MAIISCNLDGDLEGGETRNLLMVPGFPAINEDEETSPGKSWVPLKVGSLVLIVFGIVATFLYGHGNYVHHWQRSPTHMKAVAIKGKLEDTMKQLHLHLDANSSKSKHPSPAHHNASHASHASNASNGSHGSHGSIKSSSSNSKSDVDDLDCHTAEPHEPCYEAVLWHKWVGMVENPSWYKNISRASDRHEIQRYLADTKQGHCKRPCSGPYPVPHPKKNAKGPTVYCFSVSRGGAEMDTMFLQRQVGGGIFGCDAFDVFSDEEINIDGYKTIQIPSTASGVSVDGTAANSQVFLKTWMAILNSNRWYNYDFIAKVDPDAILYADRLRGHLQWHIGQNVFFLNCAKYIPATMYGALEVFSKAALGSYLSQHKRCESSLPFWSWGEDRYMAGCLEMLGVKTQPDYLNFLHDERCWGVDCGNKAAVAFHSFKQVNHWFRCYEASK